jgi:thymidine kinase
MSITAIIGPMFSGKTTDMLRRVRRYHIAGRRTMVVKYAKDTRYSATDCATHDGNAADAVSAMRLADVDASGADVVGIDEASFFPDLVEYCDAWANAGKHVIAAGLDATYQKMPFGPMAELIPRAEAVVKLSAVCVQCKADAAFSHCIQPTGEAIQIGGKGDYLALCRRCWAMKSKK